MSLCTKQTTWAWTAWLGGTELMAVWGTEETMRGSHPGPWEAGSPGERMPLREAGQARPTNSHYLPRPRLLSLNSSPSPTTAEGPLTLPCHHQGCVPNSRPRNCWGHWFARLSIRSCLCCCHLGEQRCTCCKNEAASIHLHHWHQNWVPWDQKLELGPATSSLVEWVLETYC